MITTLAIFSWLFSPITVIAWFVVTLIRVSLLAVPVWLFWTVANFGSHLQGIIPGRFIGMGLFDIIGLMVACMIVRAVVLPADPKKFNSKD